MTDTTRTRPQERCGNCEAEVPASADICPRCGALLAAYRNPLDPADALALTVAPVGTTAAPPAPEIVPMPPSPLATAPAAETPPLLPPAIVAVDPEALRSARERLVRTLAAPERELVEIVSHALTPASVPHTTLSATPATSSSISAAKTSPRRVTPVRPPVPRSAAEPRKPGFMVKGSLPVVLLWGIGLVLASCVLFLIGSAAVGTRFATVAGVVGLLLGIAGAVCLVFAMLVHLVRREAER